MIILVPDIYEADIKQYCHKKFNAFKDLSLEFVSVPIKSDCGTAESILSIRERIRGDFIVHSCDTIVDPQALLYLVNHYRLYDPMLSMMLSENAEFFGPKSAPGRHEKERPIRDVIAVEPLDKLELTACDSYVANKVVFIHSERELRQRLKIRNRELVLHSSLEVHSHFLDAHIYICKRQTLDFMAQNSDRAVFKGEVIPLLVSQQYNQLNARGRRKDMVDDDVDDIGSSSMKSDYEEELKGMLENLDPRNAVQSSYFHKTLPSEPTDCHAIVVSGIVAHRVNTVGSYLSSNKHAKSIMSAFGAKNLTSIKDCMLGESTSVGEKCVFKRGSIGSNCKIGDRVKLFDCILMDHVEIESNATLTECIVGSNSKIGTKCDLKSCIIGYRQIVPPGRKSQNEVIIEDDYAIDLSDPITVEND